MLLANLESIHYQAIVLHLPYCNMLRLRSRFITMYMNIDDFFKKKEQVREYCTYNYKFLALSASIQDFTTNLVSPGTLSSKCKVHTRVVAS